MELLVADWSFTPMRQQLSSFLAKDLQGWFVEKESEPRLKPWMLISLSKSERQQPEGKSQGEQDDCPVPNDN